ncbi:hypothetical protein [Pseudoduganella violaceinigra]|uniref:hypothetical protein n=1 Tax=Pseudoduganella violaceinigra TaxID=246602 RepID=UPI0012B5C9ED|nr:hypothetical protein [Pseudoduganella violaceinigra]
MDRPDLAWKLLLQRRLPAVLACLFPEIYALVDWAQSYCLPDKTLPPLPLTTARANGNRISLPLCHYWNSLNYLIPELFLRMQKTRCGRRPGRGLG